MNDIPEWARPRARIANLALGISILMFIGITLLALALPGVVFAGGGILFFVIAGVSAALLLSALLIYSILAAVELLRKARR